MNAFNRHDLAIARRTSRQQTPVRFQLQFVAVGELKLSRLANRDATEFLVRHQLPLVVILNENAAFDRPDECPMRATRGASDRLVKDDGGIRWQ